MPATRCSRMPVIAIAIATVMAPVRVLAHAPALELLGMPYYALGFAEGFAQVVAVLALCVGLVRYRRRRGWRQLRGAAGLALVAVVAWEVLCNADVLYTSVRAHLLCSREGGLHVYRTVQADGLAGVSGIDAAETYGFEYFEQYRPLPNEIYPVVRYAAGDGPPVWTRVPEMRSRYEYVVSGPHPEAYHIARRRGMVRERASGEVLGELVTFSVYPGWFERALLSILPAEWNPWTCGERAPAGEGSYHRASGTWRYNHVDLIERTFEPRVQAAGGAE